MVIRPGPSFSVQDVAFGWRDALRDLGCAVADVNYDDRLEFFSASHIDRSHGGGDFVKAFQREEAARLAARTLLSDCYDFWPHIVIAIMGTFVPLDVFATMKSRGHKVVVICTESPYEDDRQLHLTGVTNLLILNDPTNLETFRQLNPDTYYVPHAYRPERHHPGPAVPEMVCDFGFVGTGFPSRVELLEQIDWAGLDVLLGGNWTSLDDSSPIAKYVGHDRNNCMDNDETADLYRSCRSSLNLYRREHNTAASAVGASIGPREVELAACNTFFVRDPRPESDEVFHMLPSFTEAAEVRPLLDWWLSHDRAREQAAGAARAAIADRTFQANARWLLNKLTP